jgi:hypothetical protein
MRAAAAAVPRRTEATAALRDEVSAMGAQIGQRGTARAAAAAARGPLSVEERYTATAHARPATR